ncbi:MAG: hypothetical protein VX615_03345, partial [Planctomycetota bacterium]|nr:hypothetical protein [Planctomycetota bacterium]
MKFTNFKIILIAFVCLSIFLSNSGFAGDCGGDESIRTMFDCNGNCCPMDWVFDDICDNGVREWPEGSGIYIYLDCQEFYCDMFQCEGACAPECPEGQMPDCNGNCAPVEWITDEICDVGQRSFNGNPIVLACQEYGCDALSCEGSCWEDNNSSWSLDNVGACCMGTDCLEMTRAQCWESGFSFMGSNTQCLKNTCSCGEDWIGDCNGNCIPLRDVGSGGYCADGEWYDPDGIQDNGDEFYISLDCPELACGMSSCVGNCPGACCAGGECIITDTWQDCLELGGVFLGSYESCGVGG